MFLFLLLFDAQIELLKEVFRHIGFDTARQQRYRSACMNFLGCLVCLALIKVCCGIISRLDLLVKDSAYVIALGPRSFSVIGESSSEKLVHLRKESHLISLVCAPFSKCGCSVVLVCWVWSDQHQSMVGLYPR